MSETKKQISFIIPAFNEEKHIGGVIDSIKKHSNDLSYEIIVSDNGSTDNTKKILKEKDVIFKQYPNITIAALRNKGVEKATGEILVFLDADVYLTTKWQENIEETIQTLKNTPNIITGSSYSIRANGGWIEKYWFKIDELKADVNFINSGHLITTKQFFDQLKGFDENLITGEDSDFSERAKKLEGTISDNKKLKVIHYGFPDTIVRFFKRERWHGIGNFTTFQKIFSSKVSMLALINIFVLIFLITSAIIIQNSVILIFYPFFLVGISFLSAIIRCKSFSFTFIPFSTILYIVYFTARSLAFIDILRKKTFFQKAIRH